MKPIWKWIIGIFLAIIIILVGAIWYFSNNWKPILETKLKETVHNSTNGLYKLEYSNLNLNLALGNVTLEDAELIPDSTVYQQMVVNKLAPNNRYHVKLKALKIRSFSIWDILMQKSLDIKTIILDEPFIHLMSERHAFNDTIRNEPKKSLYDNVKDVLKSINVRDIVIDNVKFRYSTITEGKSSDLNLDRVDIKINDFLLDETSVSDSSRLFHTKMVDIHVPGFEYNLPDGFYVAKFDNLKINTHDQNILLTNVEYKPKMSKAAFFKQKNQNVTMAVLKFDTLRLEHLNFRELIENQNTIAKVAQIKNGVVDLSADKRYPKFPIVKVGHSPHQQLMKMKKILRLDSVLIDNVTVTYYEMSGKYNKEGSISFNNAKGNLTNVTNDSIALQKDKFMRADLSAMIMGAGRLQAKFGFDMLSKNGFHTYSGTLGSMNATAYNRILAPLLNVELASGNIKKVAFNMQGNDARNWGDFRFDYNNLKIRFLNEKDEQGNQSSKKVISFLVNQILINDSNPDANEIYHIGKVNYKRVPEHTFFKTLWQSLLDGIKQCAGISPEREAQLMGSAEKAKGAVENTKNVVEKTGNFFKGIFKKKDKNEEKK